MQKLTLQEIENAKQETRIEREVQRGLRTATELLAKLPDSLVIMQTCKLMTRVGLHRLCCKDVVDSESFAKRANRDC